MEGASDAMFSLRPPDEYSQQHVADLSGGRSVAELQEVSPRPRAPPPPTLRAPHAAHAPAPLFLARRS